MKTARLLFAALSLATLAACGAEPITGVSPENARRKIAPGTNEPTIQPTQPAGDCTKIVLSVDSNGNTVETCEIPERGPLGGSGG